MEQIPVPTIAFRVQISSKFAVLESLFATRLRRLNLRTAAKYQQAVTASCRCWKNAALRKTLVQRGETTILPALHKVLVVWHPAC